MLNVMQEEQNETELYRLDWDEGERSNPPKSQPERARELLATLNAWIAETPESESK